MRTHKVTVLPYDEGWTKAFEDIKAEISSALGSLAVAIEHVGSTSVRGLPAKPCIDIDVVIEDCFVFDLVCRRLAGIGYIHEGNLGIKDREAFKYTDKPHLMNHHLYVCTKHSAELHRHIIFRDYLRSHPEAAQTYGEVKLRAAQLYPDDIDGYIEYKSACIEQLYRQCGLI